MKVQKSIQSRGGKARAESLSAEERSKIASNAAAARWNIPKATHAGELPLGGAKIPCFVLEDGTRLISQRGLQGSVGMSIGGARQVGARRLVEFVDRFESKGVEHSDLMARILSPIVFLPPHGGRSAFGYEATVLTDFCEFILRCRDADMLKTDWQKRYAHVADAILRSIARVGIIALIDEATGYQEVRDRIALQKILEKFISRELLEWTKRFPDEFYVEMFRLKTWQWKGMQVNRPQVVGHYTNDIVYDRLAPGVLNELRRLNPPDDEGRRSHKHHQWLTPDIGHPKLRDHLNGVLALMKASRSWDEFKRLLKKAFPKRGANLELPLDE